MHKLEKIERERRKNISSIFSCLIWENEIRFLLGEDLQPPSIACVNTSQTPPSTAGPLHSRTETIVVTASLCSKSQGGPTSARPTPMAGLGSNLWGTTPNSAHVCAEQSSTMHRSAITIVASTSRKIIRARAALQGNRAITFLRGAPTWPQYDTRPGS